MQSCVRNTCIIFVYLQRANKYFCCCVYKQNSDHRKTYSFIMWTFINLYTVLISKFFKLLNLVSYLYYACMFQVINLSVGDGSGHGVVSRYSMVGVRHREARVRLALANCTKILFLFNHSHCLLNLPTQPFGIGIKQQVLRTCDRVYQDTPQ